MDSNKRRAARLASLAVTVAASTALALAGCAPAVPVQDAHLVASASTTPVKVVRQGATVRLSTGYTSVIAAGSQWRDVGSLPQGRVFRAVNTVFAIEGRQVHEAYLVLSGDALVGFYLPGETHFSPLDPPVPLQLGDHQ
ncbi:hypothetical protein [Burkholderia sp. Bp8963]|uniref:hypothetical protein n=1 Tax=Burkholderia sp. Bp8963 TaxID=2184547 RepID=UPI0021AB7CA8|nr:hypothetical protein [Burkholderia sp. Bp8963]